MLNEGQWWYFEINTMDFNTLSSLSYSLFHVLILNLVIVGAGVAMARFYPNIGGIIR